MSTLTLPPFRAGERASSVDEALRQALAACDSARECAVLWFAEVQRRGLYRELGFPNLELYATQALGFSRNRYWQFKRLADDLDRLPVLREAVQDGRIGWTKAQQVARIATDANEGDWVARAEGASRRELERHIRQERRSASGPVSMKAVGDGPPVCVALRLTAIQFARLEALVEKAHKLGVVPAGSERGEVVLAGLAALVEARERRAGRAEAPVQVVVRACPECGSSAVVTGRGELPLAPAQFKRLVEDARVSEPGRPNRSTIPPSVRVAVLTRDRHRCTTPGCGSTRFLELHHVVPRGLGGNNRPDNLVTLCSRCHAFLHERLKAGQAVTCDIATQPPP